jgi:RNA polymerase sigma-70 factor (ECF subfamily)
MSEDLKNISDYDVYQMLRGDKKMARLAFDEIYARYSQRIYTYCRKIINNKNFAEDVFQDVFTQLYTSSKEGADIKNLAGFLITMTRNKCYNENIRIANTFTTLEDVDLSYSDNDLETSELNKILNLAINSLPEQFKEVIVMKEHLDMSYAEIAKSIGQSVAAVRIRIYRAKEKLREILIPFLSDLQD